jgi:two-component system response regulator YesN
MEIKIGLHSITGMLRVCFQKNRFKFSGIYIRFLLAIAILVFLAIFVIGMLSYRTSSSILTTQISYERLNTLAQTRNTVDVVLNEIEKTAIAKAYDPQLLQFTQNPYADQYELLKQTIRDLVKVKDANKYIYSIYVYVPKNRLIITTEDGFWTPENFYDTSWLTKDRIGKWLTTRNIKTHSGDQVGVVTYVTPIFATDYVHNISNLLVINLNAKELLKSVQTTLKSKWESVCIIDAAGKVVAHQEQERLGKKLTLGNGANKQILSHSKGVFTYKNKKETYLVSHIQSPYNRWIYLSFILKKQTTQPIFYLRIINMITAVICAILGLVAAFVVSAQIYKPISETVSSTQNYVSEIKALEFEDVRNEMDFLNTFIAQIVAKNKSLSSTVQKNETLLKDAFIMDLFLNGPLDEISLENKLSRFNIHFQLANFSVLVILIDRFADFCRQFSEKERQTYYFGIKTIVERIINQSSYGMLAQPDKDKYAVLLNHTGEAGGAFEIAEQIRQSIKAKLKLTTTIGVSENSPSLWEINDLYDEALKCAKSRLILGNNQTICPKDITWNESYGFLISASRDEQIFNNIRQNNINEALINIEKVVNALKKESGYHTEEVYQFFYSILYTAIRAVNENGWSVSDLFGSNSSLYQELAEQETVTDILAWIKEVLLKMSQFIAKKKASKNTTLIEAVLKYLNLNYDKDISLNSMADYISLSAPYLSKLFKDEIGENFLEYLTKMKIAKSKELLRQSEFKIAMIAEKVNLGNAQNFIRIFKKYEGLTPGQYRKEYIKESLNSEQ